MVKGITQVFVFYILVATSCLAHEYGKNVLDRLIALEKQNANQEREIKQLNARLESKETSTNNRRALFVDGQIAFTAYIKHDLDKVARNTTIIFDTILLNEGGAYNNNTGIFTAPQPGVYYFSYFIGEKDDNQVNTMLAVNSANYVDAVAEGITHNHSDQGGNAGTVKLSTGDTVNVAHRNVGDHVEGSRGLRLSTFSGFMLYNVEDTTPIASTIIGKK